MEIPGRKLLRLWALTNCVACTEAIDIRNQRQSRHFLAGESRRPTFGGFSKSLPNPVLGYGGFPCDDGKTIPYMSTIVRLSSMSVFAQ